MAPDKAFDVLDVEEEFVDGACRAPFVRKAPPKEIDRALPHRPLRADDFRRIARGVGFAAPDVELLDCLLNRGSTPRSAREASFLMCGIFDSPKELIEKAWRIDELARRCVAALESDAGDEPPAATPMRRKSA